MERYFIKLYNTYTRISGAWGYNMTPGGEGGPDMRGRILTKEHRNKISISNKGILKPNIQYSYKIFYPSGDIKIINNLRLFCTDNNLSFPAMRHILKGNQTQHKGFYVTYLNIDKDIIYYDKISAIKYKSNPIEIVYNLKEFCKKI